MSEFRIQIERLLDHGEAFRFEASPAWWAARSEVREGEVCAAEVPFVFELSASRAGEDVVIEGECRGRIALECGRCGKRYPHALREPYRLVLEPLGESGAPDPEGERGLAENGVCLGEDLELGAYRGAVVGLDEFFGEVVALALPIQPLCDEACPGVCGHCGAPRGERAGAGCNCEDEKVESPFAVLAQLKQKD